VTTAGSCAIIASMRPQLHAIVLPSDMGDFSEDVRRVFAELGRLGDPLSGECAPPIDVHETDDALVVTVDLPGVPPQAIRIIAKDSALLVAGEKMARRGQGDSTFHLVERGYGRFARTVRLAVPCLTSQARAVLADGELRISIPKATERRGVSFSVPIQGPAN
jgi:HSP20 family protein